MRLSPRLLALLAASACATTALGGCAEDSDDRESAPQSSNDESPKPHGATSGLAKAAEESDAEDQTPLADGGARLKADAGSFTKETSVPADRPRSEPCPACGLG